jgi:hypothetical protein
MKPQPLIAVKDVETCVVVLANPYGDLARRHRLLVKYPFETGADGR